MTGRTPSAILGAALVFSACSMIDNYRRPEGDGGWTAAERQKEVADIAGRAGVSYNPAVTPTPPVARLDLRTALDLAAKNNRRIEIAQQQLDEVEQQVYEVRGRLLPTTTGSGRYTWYDSALRNNVALPPPLPSGTSFIIRQKDFGVLDATTQVPIDLSGELRHALWAAQAGYRGEQARVWATTLEQQLLVVQSYFQYLQARSLRQVTEQTIGLYQHQLDDAETRFSAGRVTKNDVLVVEVTLRDARQQLEQRDLEMDRARWNLNQAIGGDINASLEVVDVEQPPELPSDQEALQLAFEDNPGLNQLLQEQQRLNETLTSLERSRLPQPYAGGSIDYSSSTIQTPQNYGSLFLGFSWDFDTTTRLASQIAEARIAAERNLVTIEAQMRDIENAVRSTHKSAEERLSAYATAREAMSQAEENLRIRQQQFNAGRAQSTDVLDAERLLTLQRATVATALYEAHTRRAELQQLIGLPLDELAYGQR